MTRQSFPFLCYAVEENVFHPAVSRLDNFADLLKLPDETQVTRHGIGGGTPRPRKCHLIGSGAMVFVVDERCGSGRSLRKGTEQAFIWAKRLYLESRIWNLGSAFLVDVAAGGGELWRY